MNPHMREDAILWSCCERASTLPVRHEVTSCGAMMNDYDSWMMPSPLTQRCVLAKTHPSVRRSSRRVGAKREADQQGARRRIARHHLDDTIVHREGRVEEDGPSLGSNVDSAQAR